MLVGIGTGETPVLRPNLSVYCYNRKRITENQNAMTLSIAAGPIPLAVSPDGAVRAGGTRVTLDTVVFAFNQGATAEEIAYQYPALNLADGCDWFLLAAPARG